MKRIQLLERPEWKKLAESLGFGFHTIQGERYWDESVAYAFSLSEIESKIEDPTQEIHDMTIDLVGDIMKSEELLRKLHIPEKMWDYVKNSWYSNEMHLYGRMDLAYDGKGDAKLFELNYDTPTSLFEASFFQWTWLEEAMQLGILNKNCDQYNSIQEKLILAFSYIAIKHKAGLHFASVSGSTEDLGTIEYLRDCAHQAGISTKLMTMENIAWADEFNTFVDENKDRIDVLFKLYPWEHLFEDDREGLLLRSSVTLLEPSWKSVLSNKGILPLLWEKHAGHPNLLPSYFEESDKEKIQPGWVRKRLFSREGANVDIALMDGQMISSDGDYGSGPTIIQKAHPLTYFGDKKSGGYPVIGSWVIGDSACGMGIREDDSIITRDTSRFIPHFIEE